MAPDLPYFLGTIGITTGAGDWYEPFLNATHTHGLSGLPIALLYAAMLLAAYWLVRAPITALLPTGFALAQPERPITLQAKARYAGWLVVSALIGIATHILWDALTDLDFLPTRLLQHASTAFGLITISWFLWKRRARLRTPDDQIRHLSTALRRLTIASLIATPLLGGLALAHDDYSANKTVTEVDYNHPTTIDEGNGVTSTTYPTKTSPAPWTQIAEGVLTGATKRAGASLALAVLLYATAWQLTTATTSNNPTRIE